MVNLQYYKTLPNIIEISAKKRLINEIKSTKHKNRNHNDTAK